MFQNPISQSVVPNPYIELGMPPDSSSHPLLAVDPPPLRATGHPSHDAHRYEVEVQPASNYRQGRSWRSLYRNDLQVACEPNTSQPTDGALWPVVLRLTPRSRDRLRIPFVFVCLWLIY